METLKTIRPELLTLTMDQFNALTPYLWVFGGTILAMLAAVARLGDPKWSVAILSLASAAAGIFFSAMQIHHAPMELFNGMMVVDGYSCLFNMLFLASAGLTVFASFRYLDRDFIQLPEYYILVMFSALGMMFMSSALDLIVIFVALEIMSLSVYALVGFRRADRRSNEAAMKYFILGSAASAILLYGSALLYGSTGSTNIHAILSFTKSNPSALSPVFDLGVWLVIVGFLFKVASVPFHMWMPDVYEGAPTPVTGFMTTGLKAAAFATFVRVFVSLGYGRTLSDTVQAHLHDILWVVAVLTMAIGNFIALTQTNLKRMLAYSSIAHSGYLIVGIICGFKGDLGFGPVLLYLVSYSIMNLGAFAVLTALATHNDGGLNLHDFAGLSRRHPWLAFAMAVFLFSMAGIPPTAGFAAKYLVFYSAVQAGEIWLVVLGVLCSAVSVYYYLRVIVYMYMREREGETATGRISLGVAGVVAVMVLLTFQIGVLPQRLLIAARHVVESIV